MWRSNVLRVRSGSAAVRYGLWVRCYSSLSVDSIGQTEFLKAFDAVYPRDERPRKLLGLAVSGGVDSMALATLYARACRDDDTLPRPHGIIIDHKARPESREEALWVVEQLRSKLNIDSTVVSLEWPEGTDPMQLSKLESKFEGLARRLRYRALGMACRDRDITSLLVAHHADDQAETIMMRLTGGRWRAGLQGMHSVEWIPECHGLHGVSHSGGLEMSKDDRPPIKKTHVPFSIEQGGIRLLRPLLGFEKDRLIATCREHGTSWAEDKTNQDPSLTVRNAIRHITRHHKLPEALSRQGLISLSQHMTDRISSCKVHAEKVFNETLMALDLQTGAMIVRFPPAVAFGASAQDSTSARNEARNIAHLYLQRVVEMVSPKDGSSIGQLSNAVNGIWPELVTEPHEPAKNFAMFGVWCRPWEHASIFEGPRKSRSPPNTMEWLLSRQPLNKSDKVHADANPLVIPPQSDSSPAPPQWNLFDGRFWLKVTNHSTSDLIIRPLDPQDLDPSRAAALSDILPRWARNYAHLKSSVQLLKPQDLRWTLPAILRRDSSGRETLVALPTLGAGFEKLHAEVCEWEVRYKKVEFGAREARDVVIPGLKRGDVARGARKLRGEIGGEGW